MIQYDQCFFKLETPNLKLTAQHVPWDSEIYETVVVQVTDVEVLNTEGASADYATFEAWCSAGSVGLVSCRLPHDRLRESMLLEQHGFRFIEMVLHPRTQLSGEMLPPDENLMITRADETDLAELSSLAERAFRYERYHVDPRLDPRRADLRYGRWVLNSQAHESQCLLKVSDSGRTIALFIVEERPDQSVYWHLTAIAPEYQGHGYGRRVWRAMLRRHQLDGLREVATTISARNTPVLNLYSQLQFRFDPPEMTFHWVRDRN
jgi:RimJ/RimL family protein N-acetyltransferase